jgi:tetratricopeptide (TPR) repeat protein
MKNFGKLEQDHMFSRSIQIVIPIICAFLVIGCNPEELIKQKVPEPIQKMLKLPSLEKFGSKAQQREQIALRIQKPNNNDILNPKKPVKFVAKVELPKGMPVPKQNIAWVLFKKGSKRPKRLGTGLQASTNLDPGSYQVKVTMNLPEPLNVNKTDSAQFDVAFTVDGRVVHSGLGIQGVELTLTEIQGDKEVSRAKTGKDGKFRIAIPEKGKFKLSAKKAGYSFSPLYKIVQYGGKSDSMPFRAAKAEIRDIRLFPDKDSKETVKIFCPQKEFYLKLKLESETEITSMRAELIPKKRLDAKPTVIGEVLNASEVPNVNDPSAPQFMRVKWPEIKDITIQPENYLLVVIASDANGNAFSVSSPDLVSVDITACIEKVFSHAVSLHQKGELEVALQAYNTLAKDIRFASNKAPFKKLIAKRAFNMGLVNLHLALKLMDEGKGDGKADRYLSRAVVSFTDAFTANRNDAESIYLRAVSHYLKKNDQNALNDCAQAIQLAPRMAKAYELQGRLYLNSGRKKQLLDAVDDFTTALTIDPDNASLRKTRSATLKLDLENKDKSDEEKIDTSSIPFEDLAKSKILRTAPRK